MVLESLARPDKYSKGFSRADQLLHLLAGHELPLARHFHHRIAVCGVPQTFNLTTLSTQNWWTLCARLAHVNPQFISQGLQGYSQILVCEASVSQLSLGDPDRMAV